MTATKTAYKAPSRRAARREERRRAIIDSALRLFHEQGYGGTTMSGLAATLGGSKSTLWAYFTCKEELFAAALDELVAKFAPAIPLEEEEDLRVMLLRYAREFLTMLLSPEIVALNRLVIGEAPRFPELGRIFYERGPRRRHRAVADYFEGQMRRGRMREVDPLLASAQFHHLCQAGLFVRTMWGVAEAPDVAAIAGDAEHAVDLFLEGYGVPIHHPRSC